MTWPAPPPPLKLRPYGGIEMNVLLLLLFVVTWKSSHIFKLTLGPSIDIWDKSNPTTAERRLSCKSTAVACPMNSDVKNLVATLPFLYVRMCTSSCFDCVTLFKLSSNSTTKAPLSFNDLIISCWKCGAKPNLARYAHFVSPQLNFCAIVLSGEHVLE